MRHCATGGPHRVSSIDLRFSKRQLTGLVLSLQKAYTRVCLILVHKLRGSISGSRNRLCKTWSLLPKSVLTQQLAQEKFHPVFRVKMNHEQFEI